MIPMMVTYFGQPRQQVAHALCQPVVCLFPRLLVVLICRHLLNPSLVCHAIDWFVELESHGQSIHSRQRLT